MGSIAALSRLSSPLAPSAAADVARKGELDVVVWKTATQSRTSNTALIDATDLGIAMVASAKYIFEGLIFYDGSIAADMLTAFTVPSGATLNWTGGGPASGVSPTSYNAFAATASGGSLAIACNGTGSLMAMQPKGWVATGVTAGNLQFQFAQFASNGTATRVFLNSWLKLTRVA